MKKKGLQYIIVFLFFFNSHNLSSQSLNDTFDNIYLKELNLENIALKERIKNFPDDAKKVNAEIASALRSKDYQFAIQKAIILDSILPNNPDVKNFKGKMYYKLNELDSSLHSFNEALVLENKNKWFYMNKIGVLFEMNRYEEGCYTIEKLLEIAPDWAIAHNSKAVVLEQMNKNDEAMQSYNKALHIEPRSAQILTNRGNLFLKMGDRDKALLDYKQALLYQSDYQLATQKIKENSN